VGISILSASAMDNLLIKFIIIAFFALPPSALAATKSVASFKVISGWIDGSNIYLLYDREEETIRYSMRDIDGTITKSKSTRFYKKLSKSTITDAEVIDLATGTPSPGLIYMDSGFSIRSENEDKDIYVKNQVGESKLQCDTKPWERANPVRLNDTLLYCNNVISLFGKEPAQLPIALQAKISEFAAKRFVERYPGTRPKVASYAVDRGSLNVVAFNTGMIDAPS
jgi:hypothetical protein